MTPHFGGQKKDNSNRKLEIVVHLRLVGSERRIMPAKATFFGYYKSCENLVQRLNLVPCR